ncbi:hypothetical protein ACLOJK_013744 [Asimina triloba]
MLVHAEEDGVSHILEGFSFVGFSSSFVGFSSRLGATYYQPSSNFISGQQTNPANGQRAEGRGPGVRCPQLILELRKAVIGSFVERHDIVIPMAIKKGFD